MYSCNLGRRRNDLGSFFLPKRVLSSVQQADQTDREGNPEMNEFANLIGGIFLFTVRKYYKLSHFFYRYFELKVT